MSGGPSLKAKIVNFRLVSCCTVKMAPDASVLMQHYVDYALVDSILYVTINNLL